MHRVYAIGCTILAITLLVVANAQAAAASHAVPGDGVGAALAATETAVPGGPNFAPYDVGKVDTSATLPPYTVAPDLSNVVVTSPLSASQIDYVTRNAFVVSPGQQLEFYTVYEQARYNYEPLFITTDSLLHSFHLVFDKVLRTAEQKYFIPLLQKMNSAALAQADAEYQAAKGTDWEQAAQRTVAYLGVASKLANPDAKIPAYVQDSVTKELALINAASGIQPSVIFPELDNGEDYSQYIPRGHYTKSEELKAYFRSMMWYGRMTFRLSKPEETKSALLLVRAIRPTLEMWNDLYAPTVFFVGESDSLTIPQYIAVMDQVYGANADQKTLQSKGVDPFVSAAQALPGPKILNAVIKDTDNIDKETKGLRFMGQRFVWDAYVFRELIYRNVGTRDNPRALPMALDVFAALGSDRAKQILDQAGATSFEHYSDQLAKVQGEVGAVQASEWTQTLYGAWLYTMNTLNQPVGQGYPAFMTNQAYQDRSLYAALGSFAELKHDTILYAEQAYAEMGGGGGKGPAPEPVAPPNYVEPVPLFWARLAALAEMTQQGLGSRNLLDPRDADTLQSMAALARRLQKDSELELKGQPLSDDEQKLLRFYGGDLEHFYAATSEPTDEQGASSLFSNQPQAAVVADVATDPQSGQVLELGVGRIFDMYAVVPVPGGKLTLAHGAVFSFYEFPHPLSDRLTDEAWQQMLDTGKAPEIPTWTSSFLSKDTVDHALEDAIRQFQSYMVSALWFDPAGYADNAAKQKGGDYKFLLAQLQPLVKAGQYEGRQLLQMDFRSFDMKDAKTAIVTTRETWRGELHKNGATTDDEGPKIAERGPYTIDVTYTITYGPSTYDATKNEWNVTNVVSASTLPDWNK